MFFENLKSVVRSSLLAVCVVCIIQPTFADKPDGNAAKKEPVKSEFAGRVVGVDAEKHVITFLVNATKGNPGEEKTIEVARDVKIAVGDSKDAKLGDVKPKQAVILVVADGKVVAIRSQPVSTKGPGAYGVLKSENAKSITLTVPGGKGQPAEDRTFELARDVKVIIDETKESKLADVPVGTNIRLKLSEDNKAVAVVASGPSVNGVVKSVDGEKSTITLTINVMKGSPGEDKTYAMARNAVVFIDKVKQEKLTDLRVGQRVNATLTVDQKEVLRVFGATQGKPGASGVKGAVSAVNVEKNTLTLSILAGKGQPPEERTFEIPKKTPITVDNGKEGKLSDLTADTRAVVTLSPESVVTAIKAVGPSIPARMESVDAGKNTIKVLINPGKGNTGDEKTYDVAKDVQITHGKEKAGKLADLQAGSRVVLHLSVDKKTVIGVSVESE